MRLLILNGSPRGSKSNSQFLVQSFAKGFRQNGGECKNLYLRRESLYEEHRDELLRSDLVLFVFPLYADSMTSIVLRFLQTLAKEKLDLSNIRVAYFVHSGFPEPSQSRSLERILEKMTARLGFQYAGTIIKGGSEGMQIQPSFLVRGTLKRLEELGRRFAVAGDLDRALLRRIAGKERVGFAVRFVMKNFLKNSHPYWDQSMKHNGVYENRFARPYMDESSLSDSRQKKEPVKVS